MDAPGRGVSGRYRLPESDFCVRKDNHAVLAFYDGLGYAADDVHFLGKRLIPDE